MIGVSERDEQVFEVLNELGLHARPVTRIVQTASRFRCEVELERDGQKIAVPRRIIVVLLGSADRFAEGFSLIQRGWGLHEQWSAQGRPVSKRSSI